MAIDPTGHDLQRFLAQPDDGAPVVMLNLLRFGDDGRARYEAYMRATAPHLARLRSGKDGHRQLVLPVPYPLLLSRRYVTAPERKLPLVVSYITPSTLTAEVTLPAGAQVAQLADPAELQGFGRYSRSVRVEGGRLILSVENNLLRQRVLPDRYPAFVDYAARIDAAEEAYALIDLGP